MDNNQLMLFAKISKCNAKIAGMAAENNAAIARDQYPMYVEGHFLGVVADLEDIISELSNA